MIITVVLFSRHINGCGKAFAGFDEREFNKLGWWIIDII